MDCTPPGSFVQGIFQAITFMHAQSLQLRQTLCNAKDCSLPGSSVHEIFQARILEWVAIFFSRESSWHRDRTCVSCFGRLVLYSWATWERNCQAAFKTAASFCFPFIPHPCQHLVVSVFQTLAVLIGMLLLPLLLLLSHFSRVWLCATHRRQPTRLPRPWDSPGKNSGVGCHFLLHAWKWKVKVKPLSRVRPSVTPWTAAHQAPPSMGFSR